MLSLNIVINNAEVLQVRITIAQRAVYGDEGEQPFQILAHMRRVRKLREAFHDGGLIAAAIFLVGTASVQHAKILKSPVGAVRPQIEAVNDKGQRVFREPVRWDIEPAFLGD